MEDAPEPTAGRRHALLIGIEEYPYAKGPVLRGPYNDVIVVKTLLRDRFGFPADNLLILRDQEATQAGIRAAFEEMIKRVADNEIFVCFYSGHGSRKADPRRPEGWLESIVPHDSGRGDYPNRDIPDEEIDRWVQRLNENTPHVTLIFDCCHSGSVTRDPLCATREIEADRRAPEKMFAGEPVPEFLRAPESRPRGDWSSFGYVRGRRQAVMIAACRADEQAAECLIPESGSFYTYGALTYHLGRALEQAGVGTTWRDVFEKVGPWVTATYRRQHPQIEGNWDGVLFGTHEIRPTSYLKLVKVDPDGIELSGGAAHGVTGGSLWSVHPHGARHPDAAEELARVEIERVAVASSAARILESEDPKQLAVGQRAFLRVQRLSEPGLRIRLEADSEHARELHDLIGTSPLLHPTAGEVPADVLVRCLAPRAEVAADDPCPHLGPLREWTWAAVGNDGRLAVPTRPAAGKTAVWEAARLVGDLESVARFRSVLAIENRDPASPLRGRVRLVVMRWSPDRQTFVATEPEPGDGVVVFDEGEWMDLEIHNEHDVKIWVTLMHFGCDQAIKRLLPLPMHPTYRPDGYPLEAGEVVKVVDYYRDDSRYRGLEGLDVWLPEGFPWAAEPGESPGSGLDYLKLMVTPERADFEFLEQDPVHGSTELRDPGPQSHPLLQLARLYSCGQGGRSLPQGPTESPSHDWTTVTRPIRIRRGTTDQGESDVRRKEAGSSNAA